MVPNLRRRLPFVDEPRLVTSEDQTRIYLHRPLGIDIHIEENLAGGVSTRRGGLAAGLGAFDQDSGNGVESISQFDVDNTRSVPGLRNRHVSLQAPRTANLPPDRRNATD